MAFQAKQTLPARTISNGAAPLAPRRVACRVPRSMRSFASSAEDAPAQTEAFVPLKPTKLIDMSSPAVSRRTLLNGGLATVGLATCPCCPGEAKAELWDYENTGPNLWDGVCAAGVRQSPVNLPLGTVTAAGAPTRYTCKFGDIDFKYGSQERVVVVNTGHGTMQVNFKPGNIATIGGVDLELLQFHFHTPSEHAFDGRRAPMEVHLVHKVVATGGLAVIGVMMEGGAAIPNPSVQTAYVFAPPGPKEQMAATRPLDPMSLIPADNGRGHRPYMHYAGSLTTPPCSEGVDWFVLTEPIKVTEKQILDFMRYVGNGLTYAQNSRPVQPVNDRKFKYEL